MTRLKKELQKRNIVFEADDMMIALKGVEYDSSAKLIGITDKFIITAEFSMVMPAILKLYDRFTLKPIGEQELHKDDTFFFPGHYNNPWHSHIYDTEEIVYPWEEDDGYESNAFCDTTGFCGETSCSQYYKCTGLR